LIFEKTFSHEKQILFMVPITNARGKIVLTLDIYKTIIATTVRYANAKIPEEEWGEVYGLLYGYNKGDDVIITAAIPFTHTKKQRHILKVEFDQEDYALAASIESEFYIKEPPQYIVGWYHSHPGIKIMMSQDDVKNQLAWQTNNPLAVSLVFNHVRLLKQGEMPSKRGNPIIQLQNDTGFKCFRLDDAKAGLEASYHEIPFAFSDYELNAALIGNAQEFVRWVTKAFPRGNQVIIEYTKYITNTIQKLEDIYQGTKKYIETLERQGEGSRIPSVIETQKENAKKLMDQGNTMISIFRLMKNYLEYKEREEMVPKIEAILGQWEEKTHNFMDLFDELITNTQ
jgi:proteasome lid subunit RPN8/RPN11